MTKKRHALNVLIILGISLVLMLFIFVLVAHHRGISERARLDRSALLATGSSVAGRIKPFGQLSVAAAETQQEPAGVPDAPTAGTRVSASIRQSKTGCRHLMSHCLLQAPAPL